MEYFTIIKASYNIVVDLFKVYFSSTIVYSRVVEWPLKYQSFVILSSTKVKYVTIIEADKEIK